MSAPTEAIRSVEVPLKIQAGLRLLLEAWDYAHDLGRTVWDFAVEFASLREVDLTNNDFRWLIYRGYVWQAVESTSATGRRSCRRCQFSALGRRTCFVLTEDGVCFAREVCRLPINGRGSESDSVPHWDPMCRELFFQGHLVKRFRVPAGNQELILTAFEEESWSPYLDDPLPPRPGMNSKQRLHDTINRLNRNQKHRLIRFRGDGSGRGIRWETIDPQRG